MEPEYSLNNSSSQDWSGNILFTTFRLSQNHDATSRKATLLTASMAASRVQNMQWHLEDAEWATHTATLQ